MDTAESFMRYELKYRMDGTAYEKLRLALEPHMVMDQYGVSRIHSIYFDTPDHLLIRRSLDKPIYKEKLRLRCYGTPTARGESFVELKKKYDGVVYKRRAAMPLFDAQAYLMHGCRLSSGSQILSEIDYMRSCYDGLAPACYIGVTRCALYGREDRSLRMTFDWDIGWRVRDLDLLAHGENRPLLGPGEVLMEVKVPGAMPLWMVRLFDELHLYPSSFSKYGAAYMRQLAEETEKDRTRIWKGSMTCA